jgi:hypothetical protein
MRGKDPTVKTKRYSEYVQSISTQCVCNLKCRMGHWGKRLCLGFHFPRCFQNEYSVTVTVTVTMTVTVTLDVIHADVPCVTVTVTVTEYLLCASNYALGCRLLSFLAAGCMSANSMHINKCISCIYVHRDDWKDVFPNGSINWLLLQISRFPL